MQCNPARTQEPPLSRKRELIITHNSTSDNASIWFFGWPTLSKAQAHAVALCEALNNPQTNANKLTVLILNALR